MEITIATKRTDAKASLTSISKDDLPIAVTRQMGKLARKAPGIIKGLDYKPELGHIDPSLVPDFGNRLTKIKIDPVVFGKKLSQDLMVSYSGHCIGVYEKGFLRYSWNRGFAREHSHRWTVANSMHIASTSKFLTALGMCRGLELNHVSTDALLKDFLPANWTLHEHTKTLTFHDLLRHMTRFQDNGDTVGHDPNSFAGLKKIASMMPFDRVGDSDYRYNNANFGMCRILIPIVSGLMQRDANLSDDDWNNQTVSHFLSFMRQHVFEPAGAFDADAKSNGGSALAYPQPYATAFEGTDYGDMSQLVGGFGWFTSIQDYLRILSAFNNGHIVSRSMRRHMLENTYGLYPREAKRIIDGKSQKLTVHEHNGSWSGSGTGIRSYFFLDPVNDMQIVMFVNSAHPEFSKDDGTQFRDLWTLANKALDESLYKINLLTDKNTFDLPLNLISKSSQKAVTPIRDSYSHADALELKTADGRASQRFFTQAFEPAQTGLSKKTYTLASLHNGLCIEPYKASMDSGERITQYPFTGRRTQQFRFEMQNDGSNRIVTEYQFGSEPVFNLAFDVSGNGIENGTHIVQFNPHDGDNQRFFAAAPLKNGRGLVLDISGGLDGNELIGFHAHAQGNQMFRIERMGSWVRIVSLNGKVLDVVEASKENGAAVTLYDWHGGTNQQFSIVRIANGQVKLKARHSGKFLEIDYSGDSRRLVQNDANDKSEQKWRLHPLQYQGSRLVIDIGMRKKAKIKTRQ